MTFYQIICWFYCFFFSSICVFSYFSFDVVQLKSELDVQFDLALDVFAQSEEARLTTLKDAMRRLVVVETSLLCNRQYDLNSVPKVTEAVSVVRARARASFFLSPHPLLSSFCLFFLSNHY